MLTVTMNVVEKGKAAPKWNLESDINGELSLDDLFKFTKRSLILISNEALKEEQAKGFDKNPVVAVDGKTSKPIEDVHPLGKIVFSARQSAFTIIAELFSHVVNRSPVDTGFYRDHHFVLFNGRSVANTEATLNAWLEKAEIKDGDVLRIVNIAPYAGMLEREGVRSDSRKARLTKSRDRKQRSGTHVRAANGAYYLASRATLRKYKFNAKIRFEFINGSQIGIEGGFPTSSYRGKPLRSTFSGRTGPKGTKHKWKGPYVYPSIVIRFQGGGIL